MRPWTAYARSLSLHLPPSTNRILQSFVWQLEGVNSIPKVCLVIAFLA